MSPRPGSGRSEWQRAFDASPTRDADFATVRIGLGPQELATPLVPPPATSLEKLEPMCALALRRFLTSYAQVPDLPVTMALNGFARVHLRGDEEVGDGYALGEVIEGEQAIAEALARLKSGKRTAAAPRT